MDAKERVQRDVVRVRVNSVRAGSSGRAGGVHGILLCDTREPGDANSEQLGIDQFLQ